MEIIKDENIGFLYFKLLNVCSNMIEWDVFVSRTFLSFWNEIKIHFQSSLEQAIYLCYLCESSYIL